VDADGVGSGGGWNRNKLAYFTFSLLFCRLLKHLKKVLQGTFAFLKIRPTAAES
jgi:hypothetical protein